MQHILQVLSEAVGHLLRNTNCEAKKRDLGSQDHVVVGGEAALKDHAHVAAQEDREGGYAD